MLRYFRKAHAVGFYWVDAVCLNQADGIEKGAQISTQIPLMGETHRHAKKAEIWLGENDKTEKYSHCFA
jgi:Heterokaryon incompatibility protein (HET)